ncbi:glycosyltransferase family 4 protein [Acinetobacter sp. Marseille-Q1618]|uniref:glycosyltransferase family 4 protein n=1 Tax=Acinetobacter sp. Marseille-Q1618 TaxID=2697502 RepID=UPI0015707219|nr:glycosyltransferase family 4 protein [Acinetobacter sp. Marseille-Q1618]
MSSIAFLIGSINHSGGTERVTTLIANELAKANYEVSILSLWDGDQSFFVLDSKINVTSLFPQQISMRKNFFSAVSKIRQFCINNKIDTLIVVDSISCVFTVPALLGLNIKHICWEHFNLKVNLGSKFRDLGRWMASKWCDKIVTLTERDKSFWDENFGLTSTNKVIAIANPSPFSLQDNVPSLEYKNILCVGRLTYQKGFDLLIPAWAKIADTLVGWKITIVGTGEDEEMLKQMAIDYKVDQSIDFVGQQKNMDQFYRKASFFCMSSRFEGLPMVLLEAQSYGLPIVAFDCDTGPAEVIVNSKNGFLTKKEDIRSLTESIVSLVHTDYFESFIQASFEKSDGFNIKNIIQHWSKVIED